MRYYLKRCPHSIVFATSLNDLYNNHKINFDGSNIGAGNTRHTSLDWFLAPSDRPSIDKAPLKEHYIDIPGTNGGLDLTESLTGFPLYDYIEGEIEFDILNERKLPILDNNFNLIKEKEISWEILNRDIRSFLNGKERYMMLEDDPSWYYKGRFGVEKYDSSDDSHSKITISYKVYPYKRLSTYIYNPNSLNVFFDTVSLRADDISQLIVSFWNKTDMKMRPGDTVTFNGNTKNNLPGGEEASTISIATEKETNAYKVVGTFTTEEKTITKEIVTDIGEDVAKIRDYVLTNKKHKGTLYSDNTLSITLGFPDLYDQNNSYKKDDYVSYISVNDIKWILKANSNIAAETSFNAANWDVDLGAMNVEIFSTDGASYKAGQLVAYCVNNGYTLIRANHYVEPEEFVPEDWTVVSSVTNEELYKPYTISVQYDIGVM